MTMAAFGDRIQALMDEVYDEWNKEENKGKGKWDILNVFSEAHQIAVLFGNFNRQVENGGLDQWIYNGYFHEDAEKLTDHLATGAETDERCKKILDKVNLLDQCAQETGCDRYGDYRDPVDEDGETCFIGDLVNSGAFDDWYYKHCGEEDWWQTVCGIIDKAAEREAAQVNQDKSNKGEEAMTNKIPSKETVERLREEYPAGTRIELVSMDDPYSKLKPGDRGIVEHIDDTGTIFVRWDSGSGLGLVYGVDGYKAVREPVYENADGFWQNLIDVCKGVDAALEAGGKYIGAKMKTECSDNAHQFCRELFAAMYKTSAEAVNPAQLVFPYELAEADRKWQVSFFHENCGRHAECARAIDTEINASRFAENRYNLDLAAMKAVHDFGFARVNLVLANKLQQSASDGRFSSSNKEWAQGFNIPERSCIEAYLNAHPILIESFTSHVRKLYDEVGAEKFAIPGRHESGEVVQGYEIVRAIEFDDKQGFAIGLSPTAPSTFVCWKFKAENGQRDYIWGHYCDTLTSAAENLVARVIVHMSDGKVKEIQRPQEVSAPEPTAPAEKPSVLGQIRDAKKAPKPPVKATPAREGKSQGPER
jgi:hypothetical protein